MEPIQVVGVLIAALLCVVLVKLDGRLLGPYWTFAEIVTGMGGAYSPPLSIAVVFRRFLCPFAPSIVLNAVVAGTAWMGGLAGTSAALLLIWPGLLNPSSLPAEARRNAGLLAFIWTGFALAFTAAGLAGGALGQLLHRSVPKAGVKGSDVHEFVVAVMAALVSASLLWLVKRLLKRLAAR